MKKTCPSLEGHPDAPDYLLEEVSEENKCCPLIVRTACIIDGDIIEVSDLNKRFFD